MWLHLPQILSSILSTLGVGPPTFFLVREGSFLPRPSQEHIASLFPESLWKNRSPEFAKSQSRRILQKVCGLSPPPPMQNPFLFRTPEYPLLPTRFLNELTQPPVLAGFATSFFLIPVASTRVTPGCATCALHKPRDHHSSYQGIVQLSQFASRRQSSLLRKGCLFLICPKSWQQLGRAGFTYLPYLLLYLFPFIIPNTQHMAWQYYLLKGI